MKMSDLFELPMVVDGYSVESQPSIPTGCVVELVSDIECDSGRDAKYVAHAINNHDRMVEEIAELKGLVDSLKKDRSSAISLMSKSWRHGAEDRPMILTSFVEMANKQFESLAKLNQEGEG